MQDQAPLLTEVSGGTSIVFKNKELYSRRSPRERAEARAGAFDLEADTLYILASPLLWYGVGRVLEKLPDSSHLIAVEYEPQLAELSRQHTPPELLSHARLHLSFAPQQKVLPATKALIEHIGMEQFRRARLISLNGGYRLNSRRYTELQHLVEEEIQQFWQNKYTLMHMLPLWIKNIFRNYAQCAVDTFRASHSNSQTEARFGLPHTSLPIVVAGAGPSLEPHIEFLNRHRRQIYLLAVDTAYSTLMQNKIEPDAVIVQESQFYNLYDFLTHPQISCDLVADISSYPQVLRLARKVKSAGRLYLFASEFSKISLFQDLQTADLLPPLFPPLGSVGLTAVRAALHITNSSVIVTGLDFAFPPGQTHARGAPRHQLSLLHSTRLIGLEDMIARTTKGVTLVADLIGADGRPLRTTPTLRRYADNFARIFNSMERIRILKPRGLPLGVAELSETELSRYLLGLQAPPGKAAASAPTLAEKSGSAAVRTFLKNELDKLHTIYEHGTGFLQGTLEADAVEPLIEEINRCEYLFLHFPDTGYSIRRINPTLIKRLLVSSGHYIRVIEEALALIPRS